MARIGRRALQARLNTISVLERASDHIGHLLLRWRARRTAAVLDRLSDDLLRDIGITRGEILSVAQAVHTRKATTSQSGRSPVLPNVGQEITT